MKKIIIIAAMLISTIASAQDYRDAYGGYDYYPTPRNYSGSVDIRDQIMERNQNSMRNQLNREIQRNERAMDIQEIQRLNRNMRDIRGSDRY